MAQKIKSALLNNMGLKLLAVLFSVTLWLIVVNVDDPTQTRTFTTVVNVLNEDVLINAGKYYDIANGNNTVSFRVTAKRSIIEKLSSSDFTATADMNYLEADSRVPVEIAVNRYANSVALSSKALWLYVDINEQVTSRFVINGKTTGTPANGTVVESVNVTPNIITVTGRGDQVTSIAEVEATCDIAGLSGDITENVVPVFYDGAGNVVDVSGMTLSVSSVDVTVNLVNVKTVDIQVRTMGTLAEGLQLESIVPEPATVEIKGEPELLNEVSSIIISEGVVNLSEITTSTSLIVDLTPYLPAGITLADSSKNQIVVFVNLVGNSSKTVSLSTNVLQMLNLKSGYSASFDDVSVTLNMVGNTGILQNLDISTLKGMVDLSGLSEGTHTVAVSFEAIDGVTIDTTAVKVTIKKDSNKKPEPENTNDKENDDEGSEDTENTDNKDNKDNKENTEE